MHPISTRTLLLLLSFSSLVAAANFTACLEQLRSDPTATGGVNSQGQPTSAANATGFTYRTCTERCGTGSESFSWREFAQLFSSWLLPWLALISQIPFGSGNLVDDFMSVIMTVGSPALAAYSLILTALNGRSVYRRAQRIQHDSKQAVARALISLQQTPLELTTDKRLLAFLPVNDQWKREIVERLSRRNAWSLATGSSVAWVVIAFIFTLIDSFVSIDNSSGASQGHSVGTLWLWLLCLVVGWLWVPTFSRGELKSAIGFANQKAAKKAAKRIKLKAAQAYNSAKTKLGGRIPKRVTPILKGSRKSVETVPEVDEVKVKVEPPQDGSGPAEEGTGTNLSPLSNPAHQHSTVSFQLTDSQHGHGPHHASGNQTANQSVVSVARTERSAAQSSIKPEKDRLLNPKSRFGSVNNDEFRLAATFNYARLMQYFALVDDVLRALDGLTRHKSVDDEKRPDSEAAVRPVVVFPPGVFSSIFIAIILALILQCGTTAAATIIVIFTPTVGLGCRSLGYIIYGGVSCIIMFITIIGTIFARVSETRSKTSWIVKGFTSFIASIFHKICFLLAAINGVGLIVLSCFQFSHYLDNCYCNASVIGRGADSYVIVVFDGSTTALRNSRIAAVGISAGCMLFYMVFLWLMAALPEDVDDL